jgi:hypothetical protein
MNNKMVQVLLFIAGGFMILAIWRNPAVAADDVGSLLGNVGTFLQDAIDRVAEFIGNLGS